MLPIAKCSSCGRAIIWVTSPAGARLPLDARPVVAYLEPPDESTPAQTLGDWIKGDAPKLFISHFVTCPQPAEHSARAKTRREGEQGSFA